MNEELSPEIKQHRRPEYPIHPLILNRWSPRSFSGESISDENLMSIFEAARWAPSSFNDQPWRFIYAKKETAAWEKLFSLMGDFNKEWAKNAAVLVLIISRKNYEHNNNPNPAHTFDSGAAWENMALQALSLGYHTHAIGGFDNEKAKTDLAVPDDYQIEVMVAIGKKGPADNLPAEMKEREKPTLRKKLTEIVMEGSFKVL